MILHTIISEQDIFCSPYGSENMPNIMGYDYSEIKPYKKNGGELKTLSTDPSEYLNQPELSFRL